jgi:hypothetical protein
MEPSCRLLPLQKVPHGLRLIKRCEGKPDEEVIIPIKEPGD